ncbi:MAG: hypothetical protein ACHP84_15670 [Caulobacterales bacterium]
MMRRRHFLVGTGAAAIAAPAARAAVTPQMLFGDLRNGRFGADLSGVDFAGVLTALDPEVVRGTSLEVQNAERPDAGAVVLKNLPTVATQGVPGSVGDPGACEAESFGYCLGAYTAARHPNGERKWSAADPANQPSVAWLYHWQHVDRGAKDCPAGSQSVPYAQKLVTTGAPSMARYPYNPDGAIRPKGVCDQIDRIDVSDPGPDAARLIIGSYKGYSGIQNQQSQFLGTFKSLIRNGHAIAFTGLVPKQYCIERPPLDSGAFTAPQGFISGSGHGQVIVGFDDSKGPHGAFLVQNSFGPGWNPGPPDDPGHNGRIWFGYDGWFASQQFALIMYPNNALPPAGVKLSASSGGAPDVFLKESKRYVQGGEAYLALIVHAADAFTLNQISVTGPRGLTTTQTLNELMRFGYAYVQRKPEFKPGRYTAKLTGKYGGGHDVTYTGAFEVT